MDKEYVVHIYNGILLISEMMPFAATWLDLEIIILSEVSQTEKDKYHMISLICGINRPTDIEKKLMVTKGESGGGIN